MLAVHFGAGNIGRGFMAEVYHDNNIDITFVDVNSKVIDSINTESLIRIIYAQENTEDKLITDIDGINSTMNAEEVAKAILNSDIVSASVGPNNLKFLVPNIIDGLQLRMDQDNRLPLDIVACENMVGASSYLKDLILESANEPLKEYIEKYIGFPNSAIDRIVPVFEGTDILSVKVEKFREWIIETKDKKSDLKLDSVIYVDDILPYIERKLFTVNTGHVSLAYVGLKQGHQNSLSAIQDPGVLEAVEHILKETGSYLIQAYGFDKEAHQEYIDNTLSRFKNKMIQDDLRRIARNPITKLGYNERFIKPFRMLSSMNLSNENILEVIILAYLYRYDSDAESMELEHLFSTLEVSEVVEEVSQLENGLLDKVVHKLKHVMNR